MAVSLLQHTKLVSCCVKRFCFGISVAPGSHQKPQTDSARTVPQNDIMPNSPRPPHFLCTPTDWLSGSLK
uniref:Uncharacterized protein n=1 Tax=Anguilla anguilla TaxID=7936 RepID=A0A0E9WXJ6_ANGAN